MRVSSRPRKTPVISSKSLSLSDGSGRTASGCCRIVSEVARSAASFARNGNAVAIANHYSLFFRFRQTIEETSGCCAYGAVHIGRLQPRVSGAVVDTSLGGARVTRERLSVARRETVGGRDVWVGARGFQVAARTLETSRGRDGNDDRHYRTLCRRRCGDYTTRRYCRKSCTRAPNSSWGFCRNIHTKGPAMSKNIPAARSSQDRRRQRWPFVICFSWLRTSPTMKVHQQCQRKA